MAWPPPTQPTNFTDATAQATTHAAAHNAANLAINDMAAHVVANDSTIFTAQTELRTVQLALTATTITGTQYSLASVDMGTRPYARTMSVTGGLLLLASGGDTTAGVDLFLTALAGTNGPNIRTRRFIAGNVYSLNLTALYYVPANIHGFVTAYIASTGAGVAVATVGATDLNYLTALTAPSYGPFVNTLGVEEDA
jgi:hypothetical protein